MADQAAICANFAEAATKAAEIGRFKDPRQVCAWLRDHVFTVTHVAESGEIRVITDHLLTGNTAVLVDGSDRALLCATPGFKSRSGP